MLVVAHSSDVHLSHELEHGLLPLRRILLTAERAGAHVVLLAGDTFDHVRQPLGFFEEVAELLDRAAAQVVILPGNHDPLFDGSAAGWSCLASAANVSVLGLSADSLLELPALELGVWGRAHREYADMSPLAGTSRGKARWQVAMAHGHYSEVRPRPGIPCASWLFFPDEIAGSGADYVALGHWNICRTVATSPVPAAYSGSPDYAGTINVIRFGDGGVEFGPEPLSE